MQRQGDAVVADELAHGRVAGRGDPVVRDAGLLGCACHRGVVRVEEAVQLGGVEVPFVGDGGRLADLVRVVEQYAEVAQPAHTGLGADGGLTGLDTRIAQRALLGLAGAVVEVHLLVRAAAHTHPPAAAAVLVDEDDAVLDPLVERAGGAHGHTGRVEAVLADARQMEHERLLVAEPHLCADPAEHGVAGQRVGAAAEVVVPVGAAGHRRGAAVDEGAGRRGGHVVAERCREEVVVVVGPRLVVVVQRGQFGVGEQPGEPPGPAAAARDETPVLELPAAAPGVLVLVAAGVALAGPGLDVVEPRVLGARSVGPGLFAGDGAGVAADAFVEVHHHGHLGHDAGRGRAAAPPGPPGVPLLPALLVLLVLPVVFLLVLSVSLVSPGAAGSVGHLSTPRSGCGAGWW